MRKLILYFTTYKDVMFSRIVKAAVVVYLAAGTLWATKNPSFESGG